jgi:hypothetical protein
VRILSEGWADGAGKEPELLLYRDSSALSIDIQGEVVSLQLDPFFKARKDCDGDR